MTFTRKILLPLVALAALALPASAMAAPKPKVQLSAAAYAVAENQGAATITVVRPRNGHSSVRLNQEVLVDYKTIDGTAKAGTDYTGVSGTLDFPACSGNPSKTDPCVQQTFQVPVINNFIADGPRTLTIKLTNARTASGRRAILGYPSSAVLVIADDDSSGVGSGSTFQMATAVDYVSEGDGTATAYIIRSGDLSQGASISYATADGAAKAGTDYASASGTLNFPDETTDPVKSIIQAVPITLLHNPASNPELNDFNFNLSVPSGSSSMLGSPASDQIWIVNEDGAPTVLWAQSSYNTTEAAGTVQLLALGAGSITNNDEVDADYATADGTAKAGVNYVAQSDTFQFFAGDIAETADIGILDDGQAGDTSFTASLSNPTDTNNALTPVIGTPGTTTVNISDSGNRAGGSGQGGSGTGSNGSGGSGDQGGQIVLGERLAACGLTVKAAKAQKLLKQKGLKITLRAAQACKVTLATLIKQKVAKKHSAKSARTLRFKGKKASLTLQPGKAKTVTVKFTKKTLKAITKALRARTKLVATVTVTTRDAASHTTRKTLKITIRR